MTPSQAELIDEIMDGLARQEPELYTKFETARSVEFVFPECGKVKYGHKKTAETAAVAMNRKTGDSYDTYQCAWCDDAWHIGHSRKRQDKGD